ncbi:MAG: heat-inducible transcriptional repressor HrcA [Bacilli bacterium]|nr:heat-inducible transcriptional repressor HrcA [Bacilli bacterium]
MLNEREQSILRLVVDDYIRSAEPVGSRTVSKRSTMQVSPATIRNVMSDLEEMGYLEQPHTSAGRIPSEKGYRFYVDHLMMPVGITRSDVATVREIFLQIMDQMEQVVQQTAQIVSSLTNYTSIVLGSLTETAKLAHVDVIPLSETSGVALIVTDSGHVENRVISIPPEISPAEVQKFARILSDKLKGTDMHRLKSELFQEVQRELTRYMDEFSGAMQLLNQIVKTDGEERVYLGGTTKILNQPEFQTVEKLRPVLDLLENHDTLFHLLSPPDKPGVRVQIGHENELVEVRDCSLITATYAIDGRKTWTIGVLGPTRMEYARVIGILNYLNEGFSAAVSRVVK